MQKITSKYTTPLMPLQKNWPISVGFSIKSLEKLLKLIQINGVDGPKMKEEIYLI